MTEATTDYVPLIEKFLQHWSDSESALGREILLEDGTTRTGLQELKETFLSAQSDLTSAENDRQAQIKQRDNARIVALPTARQARMAILGAIPSSDEARQLPAKLPAHNADAQKQLVVLRDIENIWTRINALPAGKYPSLPLPFTVRVSLSGTETSVTLAAYSAAVGTLATAADALETAEQALTQARQERKAVIASLKRIFLAYRKLIRGLFPRTSPLYKSLP